MGRLLLGILIGLTAEDDDGDRLCDEETERWCDDDSARWCVGNEAVC